MIFLEDNSLTIKAVLNQFKDRSPKQDFLDATFSDFNQTKIHLSLENNGKTIFISLASPTIKAVQASYDLQDCLKEYLSNSKLKLSRIIESGYDVSFELDPTNLTAEIIENVSLSRAKIFEIPLKTAFEANLAGLVEVPFSMPIEGQEMLYIMPHSDRVMVTISVSLEDPSDAVLGKVFLQELFDTRQKHTLQNAPTVIFGKEPPAEIERMIKPTSTAMNYVSFVLFPRHFSKGERMEKTSSLLVNFRTFLHFHIKSTKAYLHTRMRSKVDDLQKVLNRAKMDHFQ